MRPTLLSSLFILLLASVSCSKDSDTAHNKYKLDGTWELHKTITGPMDSIYPPGNGYKFVFTPQNFERFIDGQKVDSGSYTITEAEEKADRLTGNIALKGKVPYSIPIFGDTIVIGGGPGIVYNATFYIRKPDL